MVKLCIHHIGANKTERSTERIGKSISPIYEALCAFDDENLITNASGKHASGKHQVHLLEHISQHKQVLIKLLLNE